jgi:hypothetical protein
MATMVMLKGFSTSLMTMVRQAIREPQPLVFGRLQPHGGEGRLDRVGGATDD